MSEHKGVALTIPEDAPAGRVQAVFSTFGILDKQRDIVERSAFTALDGTEVPLIWSHTWDSLPVGKGRIVVQPRQAVFDGTFHLATPHSRDAYETVKAMGGLQEYSYGFDVAPDGWKAAEGDDGEPARRITKISRVYEVSPVLVGAGEQTRTLAIKGLVTDLAEAKAGRRLSAASLARIQAAIEALSALVEADAASDGKDAAADADLAAADLEPTDAKPMPNFHACRLRAPGDFQDNSFRQMTRDHAGKEYRVIVGKLKGESTMTEQAFRYARDTWDAAAARAHCGDHGGTFEAAAGKAAAAPDDLAGHARLCAELCAYADWLAVQPLDEVQTAEWSASLRHRLGQVQQALADRQARQRLQTYLAPAARRGD